MHLAPRQPYRPTPAALTVLLSLTHDECLLLFKRFKSLGHSVAFAAIFGNIFPARPQKRLLVNFRCKLELTPRVRYFRNLSNIDDRVRNISWQTLNLTQTLTLTLILTLTLTLTIYIHIHIHGHLC